jgi:hypothetical protein
MERRPVESSNLKSVGYDSSKQILEIEFKDRSVYQYFTVPESVFQNLMTAGSKGSYLNTHVKGKFRYAKLR